MDVLGSLITGQDAQIQEINQSLKTIEADLKQLQDSKGDVIMISILCGHRSGNRSRSATNS